MTNRMSPPTSNDADCSRHRRRGAYAPRKDVVAPEIDR
jgi:hypothetical protein